MSIPEADQAALRERVKELTCLYGIAQLEARTDLGLEEFLAGTVELLPPALQHPDHAGARVVFDDLVCTTGQSDASGPTLQAEIVVNGTRRGSVSVSYGAGGPWTDQDPFLPEETALLEAVARQVALTAEQKQSEREKSRLEEQLRHADRLATIGQLSAGLAHELNEPLGNILGFAQLAAKTPGLPDRASEDITKITRAALHAREVIRKLMLFARQSPPQTQRLNLDDLVEDGLYFLEGRCAKNGIELVRRLNPDLPEVVADPSQMLQVLVNLVVNAIQAMPHGGRLAIATDLIHDRVVMTVSDTGVGMTEEVRRRVFIPFFTTKDVNEGTGLGLAVVHGIVSAHGGKIEVDSKVGVGSRFSVSLPLARPVQVPGDDDEQ